LSLLLVTLDGIVQRLKTVTNKNVNVNLVHGQPRSYCSVSSMHKDHYKNLFDVTSGEKTLPYVHPQMCHFCKITSKTRKASSKSAKMETGMSIISQ
jgi:hypothetical protein